MEQSTTGAYSLTLAPETNDPLTVLFEPGAGEYVLNPGESFRIVISGPEDGRVELTHGQGYVSVWPSPELSMAVYDRRGEAVHLLGY